MRNSKMLFRDTNHVHVYISIVIAEVLRLNESLIVLSLGKFNQVTNETIRHFASVIQENETIEHLPLSGSRSLSEDTTAVEKIVRVIVHNRTQRERRVQGKFRCSKCDYIFDLYCVARKTLFSSFLQDSNSKGSWNRSKLMILGANGVGKTYSLIILCFYRRDIVCKLNSLDQHYVHYCDNLLLLRMKLMDQLLLLSTQKTSLRSKSE